MRSFEEVRSLFQAITEQEQQFATGSGSGAAGSRATFTLSQPILGANSVVATCLSDCPPGRDRTGLVKADDGNWYAFPQEPTTRGPETISQNRRTNPQEAGSGVAALVIVARGEAIVPGGGIDFNKGSFDLYIAGHVAEPVFLCNIPNSLPPCPPEINPSVPTGPKYESYDAYYMGGDGVEGINWGYHPQWYCRAYRNGLARTSADGGVGGVGEDASILILVPPAIGFPPVTAFTPFPFPIPVIPQGRFYTEDGLSFFIDELNQQTHPRSLYPTQESYDFAVGLGTNISPVMGAVGAFSLDDWVTSIYFATKKVTVRRGENPPGGLSFTSTLELDPELNAFGAVNGVFTASMSLIGSDRDNVCSLSDVDGTDPPDVPRNRQNTANYALSGDRNYWYATVFDQPSCNPASGSLEDLRENHRYFRIRGTNVESSDEPFEQDWRFQDGVINKALQWRNGNLWRGQFVSVNESGVDLYTAESINYALGSDNVSFLDNGELFIWDNWAKASDSERLHNIWYTSRFVTLVANQTDPVTGMLKAEDRRDGNGDIVTAFEGGPPLQSEVPGTVKATVRLAALSPEPYRNGGTPMLQIATAGFF